MDRLSPISTDSGFESCCCPSSPATSSSNTNNKLTRSLFVPSLPSPSTALGLPAGDAHTVICDLTPSSSESSLYREDSISLDSVSTNSPNNECPSCSTFTPSCSTSTDSYDTSGPSQSQCVDGGSIRYHCLWNGCVNIYEKADDLYDHVIELHINPLRDLTPETSKTKQEKEDDESIKCMWDDCTMFLRRGDNEKKISWLMDHYRTRHARTANPFHCVIEGCQMRFSTTNRLEEHVRVEHINPPKPVKETPVVVQKESCYGWRPRLYYPVRPRPMMYCPHFDEKLLKCVRFMNKHSFKVAFNPIDPNAGIKGAKRRKSMHRYAYKIVPSDTLPAKPEKQTNNSSYDIESVRGLSIFDLFPPVVGGAVGESAEPSTRNSDAR
ncbi:hypothetical protein RB195_020202 [Necator americanus]|uniref:C2H2-type domain-containing protein n=1 Tax=Necator americanus TaxID=51031 RepID=A0ABR1CIQ0_NECAM